MLHTLNGTHINTLNETYLNGTCSLNGTQLHALHTLMQTQVTLNETHQTKQKRTQTDRNTDDNHDVD